MVSLYGDVWNTDAKSQSQGEIKISSADSMTKHVDPAISYTELCVNVVVMLWHAP